MMNMPVCTCTVSILGAVRRKIDCPTHGTQRSDTSEPACTCPVGRGVGYLHWVSCALSIEKERQRLIAREGADRERSLPACGTHADSPCGFGEVDSDSSDECCATHGHYGRCVCPPDCPEAPREDDVPRRPITDAEIEALPRVSLDDLASKAPICPDPDTGEHLATIHGTCCYCGARPVEAERARIVAIIEAKADEAHRSGLASPLENGGRTRASFMHKHVTFRALARELQGEPHA